MRGRINFDTENLFFAEEKIQMSVLKYVYKRVCIAQYFTIVEN